jgi:DNA-binding response OmpR family regulator
MTTILVAEDDEGFRALVSEVLAEAGYRVAAAKDGQEAWELLEQDGADMAVLDLNMPRLDGMELTRRLRADSRYRDLPVLMLTIRALVEDQISGYERGADDYLTKPFDVAMLVSRVRALLRRAAR